VRRIRDVEELDAVLEEHRAVLFKHSTRCGSSARALRRVEEYERLPGAAPVFLVDVIEDRDLARSIAKRLDVAHQSPQAIVVHRGTAVWHASHMWVRTEDLARHAGGSEPAD
jgi:bacillithiol system protein YtxJ